MNNSDIKNIIYDLCLNLEKSINDTFQEMEKNPNSLSKDRELITYSEHLCTLLEAYNKL